MSLLRPSLATLPMRSWNSDDSNVLASCETRNKVICKSGSAKRARLCRNAHLDDTTEAVVAAPNIPIIISSPDDCACEVVSENKLSELPPAQRRSSCPFSAYDVHSEESSSPAARRNSATTSSCKRRRDFALSYISHRRPSLQSITTPACHIASHDEPAGSAGAEQQKHNVVSEKRPAAAAVRANSECHTSSLDVHWSTRRLSLPHSSTSAVTDDQSRLQLPSGP